MDQLGPRAELALASSEELGLVPTQRFLVTGSLFCFVLNSAEV